MAVLLFNIAFIGLLAALEQIPNLRYAFYADDIPLCAGTGSLGGINESLQRAADRVNPYAEANGLRCSPQKSELFIVRKHSINSDLDKILITLYRHTIQPATALTTLGLTTQAKTRNDQTLYNPSKGTDEVIHMIRRITNRHQGMKEKDTLQLVQAFAISRIPYVAPYIVRTRTDTDKLDRLIYKATEQTLDHPISTSTGRLLSIGLHNTIEELIEGHL